VVGRAGGLQRAVFLTFDHQEHAPSRSRCTSVTHALLCLRIAGDRPGFGGLRAACLTLPA
jgi:hypothetical protein